MSQHLKYQTVAANLQIFINHPETWLATNKLKVSPNNSSPRLLTSFNKKYPHNHQLPFTTRPSTSTPSPHSFELTFRKHTDTITTKSKRRLNILRAVTTINNGLLHGLFFPDFCFNSVINFLSRTYAGKNN